MNRNLLLSVSIIFLLIQLLLGTGFWTATGLAITLYYTVKVIFEMGESIPIPDIMISIMGLQWVLGPKIEYINSFSHWKFKMYVDEPVYMAYVVPAIILFKVGLYLFPVKTDLNELGQRVRLLVAEYPKLPYYMIAGGFLLPYLSTFMPPALGFIFYLLGNLKYIGSIYLLFSPHSNRLPIFFGVMAFTAISSIAIGMFHDLLLWGLLTLTFVAHELKFKWYSKLTVVILGVLLIMTIQGVKSDFRNITWQNSYDGNKAALFLSMASESWRNGSIITPTSEGDMNMRLNQGWIISSVMNHVPNKEPFAEGETIREAIYSSLVPRILDPNKKIAGGRENFRRFSGQHISEGTSMGISLAGEGYANYGKYGGMMFLLIWGAFFGWFWQRLDKLSIYYPTILIWSPIIFLQVVKAETEFAVVLNHLIKSSILVFGLLWAIKKYSGIRI